MKDIDIYAVSPAGERIRWYGKIVVAAQAAGEKHWTLHRESDNAIVGIVPKEWALILDIGPDVTR